MARVKLTRLQKLDRKGILHFEVDGALAFLSKKVSEDKSLSDSIRPLVTGIAITAAHIRDRVKRGQYADGVTPTESGDDTFALVSDEFRALMGLTKTEFKNHTELRQACGSQGLGNLSGGMWSGVQANARSRNNVEMSYGGQSIGSGRRIIRTRKITTKTPRGTSSRYEYYRPDQGLVENRQKASNVFRKLQFNPLEARHSETGALREAIAGDVRRALVTRIGGGTDMLQYQLGGVDASLRAKLAAAWR